MCVLIKKKYFPRRKKPMLGHVWQVRQRLDFNSHRIPQLRALHTYSYVWWLQIKDKRMEGKQPSVNWKRAMKSLKSQ